jgi:hypothetical protein
MFGHANLDSHGAALPRFTIASLDDELVGVSAQYNPKELQYDRPVSWHAKQGDDMQFAGTQGRSLTVELFFDGFEAHRSVAPWCAVLEKLATVIDPDSRDLDLHRPHYCMAIWGDHGHAGLPRLRCVIENVTVKYTMFSRAGIPLRATCTVKLKETDVLSKQAQAARDKNRRKS